MLLLFPPIPSNLINTIFALLKDKCFWRTAQIPHCFITVYKKNCNFISQIQQKLGKMLLLATVVSFSSSVAERIYWAGDEVCGFFILCRHVSHIMRELVWFLVCSSKQLPDNAFGRMYVYLFQRHTPKCGQAPLMRVGCCLLSYPM